MRVADAEKADTIGSQAGQVTADFELNKVICTSAEPATQQTFESADSVDKVSLNQNLRVNTDVTETPSTSGCVSPYDISPPPKACQKNRKKRKNKTSASEHLTSSPYKRQLLEEIEAKRKEGEEKLNRKNKKAEKKAENDKMKQRKKKSKNKSANKTEKRPQKEKIASPESSSTSESDDEICLYCCEPYSKTIHDG